VSDTKTSPDAANEQTAYLRHCWRIGDALAASNYSGIPYKTPDMPQGLSVEAELAILVYDAGMFITYVHRCLTTP
jgi:hypothetical protein